jgi:hypothetical protein
MNIKKYIYVLIGSYSDNFYKWIDNLSNYFGGNLSVDQLWKWNTPIAGATSQSFEAMANGTYAVITNAAGQLVFTQELNSGENKIELANVESGIYFISATDLNRQVSIQRISAVR